MSTRIQNVRRLLVAATLISLQTLVAVPAARAQIGHGGRPLFNFEGRKAPVATVRLDSIDNSALLQADVDMLPGSSPMRIGVQQQAGITSRRDGRWTTLADGSRVWRVGVQSPGATFVALHFDRFRMPAAAQLYVYDRTGYLVLGRFGAADVKPDGTFYTQALPGDVCYVEYHEPAGTAADSTLLSVDEVVHGYKDFMSADGQGRTKGGLGNSDGSCHTNVACSAADPYRDQVHAVCCITITASEGTYLCSGTLMNNTALDRTPYVLSAHHCQDVSGVSRFTFYFNYESPTCTGNAGPTNQSVTGAEIVSKLSKSSGSDFLLLRLYQQVPAEYNAYYAGWDRTQPNSPSLGCCIHHPGGDLKKIALPGSVTMGNSSYAAFYRAQWNNRGVVEGGSSGSALFNAEGLVVGQLLGGSSSCSNASGIMSYDYYGRVGYSWAGGGKAASRLKDWLDPTNSGVEKLRGSYADSLNGQALTANPEVNLLTCYPNPTSGMLRIEVDEPGEGTLVVSRIDGVVLREETITLVTKSHQLNMSWLKTPGVYTISLTVDDKQYANTLVYVAEN